MLTSNYFEAKAIKDHKPIHQSQLGFKKGDTVLVFETAPTGWWRGELYGKKGLFPQSYVTYNKDDVPETSAMAPHQSVTTTVVIEAPPVPEQADIDVLDEFDKITAQLGISKTPPPPVPTRSPATINTTLKLPTQSPMPTASSSATLTTPTPQANPKLSPRMNLNREQMSSDSPRDTLAALMVQATGQNTLRTHSRKTSGPSTFISEDQELEQQIASLGGSSNTIGRMDDDEDSKIPAAQLPSKYRTLPSGNNKVRKPLITRPEGNRITLNEVNTEVPYYITRCVEPHNKQAYEELSIKEGDLVVVYNSRYIDSLWWVGKLKNNFGVFPRHCVDIIKDISPTSNTSSPANSSSTTQSPVASPATSSPSSIRRASSPVPVLTVPTPPITTQPPITPPLASPSTNRNQQPQQQQYTEEELSIANKIEQSLSHLQTTEELMTAVKNLAIKFVKQTAQLKLELDQEKTLRMAFERELMSLKSNQR
eukprot:gene6786-7888_t